MLHMGLIMWGIPMNKFHGRTTASYHCIGIGDGEVIRLVSTAPPTAPPTAEEQTTEQGEFIRHGAALSRAIVFSLVL